jgi:ketosteroid isomerase-like protein
VSPTNAELVSDAIDAYNRGDLDGALQDAAPDLELDWSRAIGPYRGMYRLGQIRALFDTFGEAFASVRFEPQEFIEAGEHVIVVWTLHTVGRGGIETSAKGVWLWTVRDGSLVRNCLYQSKAEALAAAGLSAA